MYSGSKHKGEELPDRKVASPWRAVPWKFHKALCPRCREWIKDAAAIDNKIKLRIRRKVNFRIVKGEST